MVASKLLLESITHNSNNSTLIGRRFDEGQHQSSKLKYPQPASLTIISNEFEQLII